MADRNIEVAVRLRPPLEGEVTVSHENLHLLVEENSVVVKSLKHTFDHVFNEESSNDLIYQKIVAPHIKNLLSGFNVTVMAYGSTGSGKSFTMGISAKHIKEDLGIIPLGIKDIFNSVKDLFEKKDVHLSVSFFEIYLEDIKDLLNPSNSNLIIRGEAQEVKVSNLSEVTISSFEEAIQLLEKGSAARHTDLTAKNVMSSRSHAIFVFNLVLIDKSSGHTTRSKFQLVDLAGSERTKTSKTEGQQFKQGLFINKALSTLGRVINSIFKKERHIPYRDSSLTRILQDSIGGNSYTVIVACLSPSLSSLEESHSTIRYAHQASCIKNNPKVNKDPKEELIEKLQSELNVCKKELEKYREAEDRCQKILKEDSFKTTSEKDLTEVFETYNKYDVTTNQPTTNINICDTQSSLELHQEPREKEEGNSSIKNIEQPAETALKRLNHLNQNLSEKEKELENYYIFSKIIDVSQPIEASDVHKLILEKIHQMEEERKVLIEKYDETQVKTRNELEDKIKICEEQLKNKNRSNIFKMAGSQREEFLKNEIKELKLSKIEIIKKYQSELKFLKKKEYLTSKSIAAQEKKLRNEEARFKKTENILKNKINIFEKKIQELKSIQVKSSLNKKTTKKELSENILNQINEAINHEISTEKLKSDIIFCEEQLKNLKEQAETDELKAHEKNLTINMLALNVTKMKKTLKDSLNEEKDFEFLSNLDEAKSALNILLQQIKVSEKEKNELHRRLEESNSSLESSVESFEKLFKENLTLTKENNDLKSKQASSLPPIKKSKKKEPPSQNVIDPSEINVFLENPDESFESTSDINDPDYRATPLNKRKLKRKIIPETVLLEDETPVKKMMHGCRCPSNCTTLRCACRKKSHICGSYCTCDSKICLNVAAPNKN